MERMYKVIEDNGGGLHLLILSDDDQIEWYGTNFEYTRGILTDTIKELQNGANPLVDFGDNFLDVLDEMMDRGELKEGDVRDLKYHFPEENRINGGWSLVADNEGIYPQNMGYNAREEFGIKDE